jgi:hypothetical protein
MYNGYPVYNNNNQMYMQNLQEMRDRIDNQMRQMQNQQFSNQQTPQINQTFQISPQNQNSDNLDAKIVNDIDEVKNTLVMKTGVFVNKDYSILWIKDITGNIRTFNTSEIIEIDEKEKEINRLNKELEEMKKLIQQNQVSENKIENKIEKKK